MERSEIHALAKLGANRYRLRTLYLPREEIHGIRQQEGKVYSGLRELFEGIPCTGDTEDGRMAFILPDSGGGLCARVKDMGPGFQQKNLYNGASMEGTREDMMAQLRESLQKQGYHFRPNALLQGVDVLDALQKIVECNTVFYQTDFAYDREMLLEAARDGNAPRCFFWMSRKDGTWCFPERDVHILQTARYNTWLHYGSCRNDNVKAFRVELHGMRDGRAVGDILEMDYQKHLDYICTHSHEPTGVEVVFKNPNSCRTFGWREYEQNLQSIAGRYGTMERKRYLVGDEYRLSQDMAGARRIAWDAVEPIEIGAYVARLECDRLHDYGYTAGDMSLAGPLDAELAIQRGLECYILGSDGSREPLRSWEGYQQALSHGKLFGMDAREKEILQYFKQGAVPLFNQEEVQMLYFLALRAGMDSEMENSSVLDSIIHKVECSMLRERQGETVEGILEVQGMLPTDAVR